MIRVGSGPAWAAAEAKSQADFTVTTLRSFAFSSSPPHSLALLRRRPTFSAEPNHGSLKVPVIYAGVVAHEVLLAILPVRVSTRNLILTNQLHYLRAPNFISIAIPGLSSLWLFFYAIRTHTQLMSSLAMSFHALKHLRGRF